MNPVFPSKPARFPVRGGSNRSRTGIIRFHEFRSKPVSMCPLLSVAENYDRYFASPLYERRYPYPSPSSLATIIGKIGARGNRVLDFGCGNGRYTAPLLELTGAMIVATTSARKRIKPSRFLGDAHELWTRFHSDGRRVCAWLASGEWPTECRNKPLLTSTDVGGLQHGLLITGPHRTDAQHSNLRFSCSILIGVVLVNFIGDARAYGAEYVNEDAVIDGDLITARTGGHCHLLARHIIDQLKTRI